ncbi:MAG TPA: nucleotide exchange factor GrpE [Polyangiaceae bacterium]
MSEVRSSENDTPADGIPDSENAANARNSGQPPADLTAPDASEPPPADPLEAAKSEAQKNRDQLLRVAADFDNYKKRARRELGDAVKVAREDLLRELLPVFDNLERASAHAGSATDTKALADGISMVQRQFLDVLGKLGIERIVSVGQPFDPAVHEAVQHLETDEFPPGAVATELQAGYRLGERVLRPAMVVVAKTKSS